ncbi:MAG TPA: glycosyltransferase [Gemmatimonadales bacterium]
MPLPPPLRVLHVDSGRAYRGGQNQVRLLLRELAREGGGLEQRLVTSGGGELARRVAALVPVVPVPWTIGLDPRAWWGLRGEARAFRPDILHAHDGHALRLVRWAGGRRASRVVATRRVSFPVHRGSPLRGADAVIAISQAVRAALLAGGVPPARIVVIPSGIDPDEVRAAAATPLAIRSRLGLPAGAPLAVNVAALEPPKDQRTLVRAAHAARELRPDLHWVIAGEGKLRRALQDESARLSVRDRVHLVGYIPEADGLIREADVLVMSSQEEGLGTVVLDALALGKPVVATRGGGLPEIVPAEWLVPVGDAQALARKVVAALDHPSPVPLPPRFTAPAMAAGVLALYRSLV